MRADRARARRCRYELRSAGVVLASGVMDEIGAFQVGDRLDVGGSAGIVRAIEPDVGERMPRLILELDRRRG